MGAHGRIQERSTIICHWLSMCWVPEVSKPVTDYFTGKYLRVPGVPVPSSETFDLLGIPKQSCKEHLRVAKAGNY